MYGLFIIDGCTIFSDTLDITRSQIFKALYQLPICKEPAKKALYYQQLSWLDEYNDDTYEYDDYDSYYDYCNDQSDDNHETEKEEDIQDENIPKITQHKHKKTQKKYNQPMKAQRANQPMFGSQSIKEDRLKIKKDCWSINQWMDYNRSKREKHWLIV